MKHREKFRANRSGLRHRLQGGTLVGVFIGIVLGVMGAAVAVWFMNNKVPSPFVSSKPGQAADALQASNDVNQPLQGKPGDPPPKRFDFYDILPGTDKGKTDVEHKPPADSTAATEKPSTTAPPPKPGSGATPPKEETPPSGKAPASTTAPAEPASGAASVYMQAGSFQDSADADNQKAKLALLGFEANVLQVMVQDRTWYRVRVGPYANAEEASRARADLAKHGIQVVFLR
ncbi:MAG: SPOR domain-containing protein [Betaproteobacteria bacterium]|nr:SPOR domain-containing protein [Betaproteobacteria bacterium]